MTSGDSKSEGQQSSENKISAFHEVGGPFAAVADGTRMPIIFSDPNLPDNPIIYVNDSFLELTGYDRGEVIGQSYKLLMGADTDRAPKAQFAAAFNGYFEGFPEVRLYRKDGSEFWAAILVGPVLDAGGTVTQHFVSFIDVTREKQEERLQFLLHELDHRVKNMLATVQSIAVQTLRSAGVAADVRDALEGRILSLSKAHDLVAREGMKGATLREVVDQIVLPFREEGSRSDRISIEGGDVHLQPKAVMALAMMFHELIANAAKYGALSNDGNDGRIDIAWQTEPSPHGDQIRLKWQESGGPKVNPPSRQGFGSRLIENGLAQELDGEVHLDYAPGGVVCRVTMPVLREDDAS